MEPPKFHDVGGLRELALYGDIDFIPTEQYSAPDAQRAYDEAAWVLALAQEAIRPLSQLEA